MTCAILTLYTIASARQIHAVRLFHQAVRDAVPDVQILDWTDLAAPPAGLGPIQRRDWNDTDAAGEVFSFCRDACGQSDLVVYLGPASQDAGVEVGMALAAGVPILGVRGPHEEPGLMLQRAVRKWTSDVVHTVHCLEGLAHCLRRMDRCSCRCELSALCPLYEERY